MNKKLKMGLLAMALSLCSIGAAQAAPALWWDVYDPRDIKLSAGQTLSYTHDLVSHGYQPGIDTIVTASLTFWLYDDSLRDGSEKVSFNFDGTGWTPAFEVEGSSWLEQTKTFGSLWYTTWLVPFVTDGFLNVALKAKEGDFKFDKSLLVAYGYTSKVPEPTTLALLGAGLLGMALMHRRRRQTSL